MAEDESSTNFPLMTQLDLGYSQLEDRLVLIATLSNGKQRAVFLTRRLLRQLIADYAKALKGTSETVARASFSDRDEVLRMEHIGATAQPDTAGPDSSGEAGESGQTASKLKARNWEASYLATGVKIGGDEQALRIGFLGYRRPLDLDKAASREPICAMRLDRTSAHKVLALLNKQAQNADWGLDGEADWLRTVQPQAVAGGRKAN